MTVQQFHREFKITFDKIDSEAYPELLDGEIDYYLNEAQDRFIKQRYGPNNIYRAGFEQIQKRTEDLKEIVKTRYAAVSEVEYYTASGLNVYRADVSSLFTDEAQTTTSTDEYMFFVKTLAQTCKGECCEWNKVELVQQDDVAVVKDDPFNKPLLEEPVIFFEDGDIFIWTAEGATVGGLLLTFIKRPAQINIGTYGGTLTECELSEYTHREILQMAVKIALENIESPRQQSQDILNVKEIE